MLPSDGKLNSQFFEAINKEGDSRAQKVEVVKLYKIPWNQSTVRTADFIGFEMIFRMRWREGDWFC